ncbi:MAG: hypothetical protein IPO21_17670 [Bacteroidales bacterium]|nr:hypothetical protein [Bacteroidales bacterium]
MKRFLSIITILVALTAVATTGYSQCKNFAKLTCKPELDPYIHDGIFNATELSEGESAELFKTFYSGQEYRIAVCGDAALPPILFEIMDSDRNVLFSNKDADYAKVWDFKLEASQQLIVSIQVNTNDDKVGDLIAKGCVAVLIGFLNTDK